jgi:hypothetical protein
MNVEELITKVKSSDVNVRAEGWQNAHTVGPKAIRPLAKVLAEGELEVSRAAKRALWKIVYHVGRPGAQAEKADALPEYYGLLGDDQPVSVRREVIWMVSELCDGCPRVASLAALLSHSELREDARMALERIPGEESLKALKAGFDAAPEDFKYNLAHSLRVRGVEVSGYPSQKLVPKKS